MEYETISLDDYIQTGEGGTALAYTHKTEKRLAKLYNTTFEADLTRREFEIARDPAQMEPVSLRFARLERRLGPYAAVKIPNMMEQVYHHPLLPETAEQLLPLFETAG